MNHESEILDRFTQSFRLLDDLTCTHDEPPPEILSIGNDPSDWMSIRWQPTKVANPTISVDLVRRAGQLPQLCEQLATTYCWLTVDLRLFCLFANPPSLDLKPLADAMFGDHVLNNTLLPGRYVRFAQAANGSYDPICFDLNRMVGGDCPIVRISHESVLMHNEIGIPVTVFPSFRTLVLNVIELARLSDNITKRVSEA